MHKLILIEKYGPSSFFWPNLLKNKTIVNLSVEEILNKYQGFEGELIFTFSVEDYEINLTKMMNYYQSNMKKYLMLHVTSDEAGMPAIFKKQAISMGYDVGICEEEWTIYSSIFNEILFGHLDELISYKNFLNDHFLFQDKLLAKKYINMHNKLSALGKDVEDYIPMNIYEIWKIIPLGT